MFLTTIVNKFNMVIPLINSNLPQDYSNFNYLGADGETRWNFIKVLYEDLGLGMLNVVQHIGLWGAIISSMLLIIGLVVWQGNQKERTKVIKNIGTLVLCFILLVNIVSWVSFFQRVTYLGN